MHTACLPTVHVVVAATRCQYWGWGMWYPRSHVHGVGVGKHTHPLSCTYPPPSTYPSPRHIPRVYICHLWYTYHFHLWYTCPSGIPPHILCIPTPTRLVYQLPWTYPTPSPLDGTWDKAYLPTPRRDLGPGIPTHFPPPLGTEWLTDACENITFRKLLLRSVRKGSDHCKGITEYRFSPCLGWNQRTWLMTNSLCTVFSETCSLGRNVRSVRSFTAFLRPCFIWDARRSSSDFMTFKMMTSFPVMTAIWSLTLDTWKSRIALQKE